MMTRAGRVIQVQYVLTRILIYVAIATDLPPWAFKAIDKIRRAFLWRGRKEAKGGHCLIAWPKVCRSRELGGLGIVDLKALSQGRRQGYSPVCHGIPKILQTNTNTYTCIRLYICYICKSGRLDQSPKAQQTESSEQPTKQKRVASFFWPPLPVSQLAYQLNVYIS